MTLPLLFDGPEDAHLTVILAHGAGVAMDSPFMNTVAAGIAEKGFRVARFEFPYMRRMRDEGGRRPPDSEGVLRDSWREAIAAAGAARPVIGGKSLGGRIASIIADEVGARGLLCLGYPFHPRGDSARLRIAHLRSIRTPTLVLQGTRDGFGARQTVEGLVLSPAVRVLWLEEGDHSFAVRKGLPRTTEDNMKIAIGAAAAFLSELEREAAET